MTFPGVAFIMKYGWATTAMSAPAAATWRMLSKTRAGELSVTWTASSSRPPDWALTTSTTFSLSASVIAGPSPAVPQRNSPFTPSRRWCSTILRSDSTSTLQSGLNGVGAADQTPLILVVSMANPLWLGLFQGTRRRQVTAAGSKMSRLLKSCRAIARWPSALGWIASLIQ